MPRAFQCGGMEIRVFAAKKKYVTLTVTDISSKMQFSRAFVLFQGNAGWKKAQFTYLIDREYIYTHMNVHFLEPKKRIVVSPFLLIIFMFKGDGITSHSSFLVPSIGGRQHIITQLATYTTYIPLIYCLQGGYMLPTTFYGNQKQPLNKDFQICQGRFFMSQKTMGHVAPVLGLLEGFLFFGLSGSTRDVTLSPKLVVQLLKNEVLQSRPASLPCDARDDVFSHQKNNVWLEDDPFLLALLRFA